MRDFRTVYVDIVKALWCGCVLVSPILAVDAWIRQEMVVDQLVELKRELDARANDGEDGDGEDDNGEDDDGEDEEWERDGVCRGCERGVLVGGDGLCRGCGREWGSDDEDKGYDTVH